MDSVYRSDEDEVVRLGKALRRRAQLDAQAEALSAEVTQLQSELATLQAACAEEQADVDRLKRASLASLLWSAIGKRQERLEKEQAEAVQAELRYTATQMELDATRGEAERVEVARAELQGTESAYQEAFAAKVKRVLGEGGPSEAELRTRIEAVHQRAQAVREIDEALEVGCLVDRHLSAALERIRVLEEEEMATMTAVNAAVFTTIMTMAWGSTTPTALETHLERGQHFVRRYIRELADVPVPIGERWRTDFLGVFVQLAVGRGDAKARKAKDDVRRVLDEVRETQKALSALRTTAYASYEEAMGRYTEAVERA